MLLSCIIIAVIGCISGIMGIIITHNTDAKYNKAFDDYGFSQGDIGIAMSALSDTNTALAVAINSTNDATISSAVSGLTRQLLKLMSVPLPLRRLFNLRQQRMLLLILSRLSVSMNR